MANIIELEASYYLDEKYSDIMKNIEKEGFEFSTDIVEEDTYFTDKNLNFIADRTCLRTRKVNQDFLELTYKPKSDNNTEKYGKKEVNIKLDAKDYLDIKYVIKELGYIEYVCFKKHRKIYSKTVNDFQYNIMIDEIEGIGKFIELEILADSEEEKERLRNELNIFVEKMGCQNLKEKKMPYRDIVKEHFRKEE